MPSAWQRRNQCNTNTKKIWNRDNPSLPASTSEYLACKRVTSKARQIYPSPIVLFLPHPSLSYFFFTLTCQTARYSMLPLQQLPCHDIARPIRASSSRDPSTSLSSSLPSRSLEIPTCCIDQRIIIQRRRDHTRERISQGRRCAETGKMRRVLRVLTVAPTPRYKVFMPSLAEASHSTSISLLKLHQSFNTKTITICTFYHSIGSYTTFSAFISRAAPTDR